ncbi:RnfH family protein [Luteimonas sp BLCC-B24]|uniref:RnfH family protein n=1 Tax=Luteimonas sp. BLCC-B24 TaxID=3025317 RepID=UPI00234D3856|nr:RnfH family protein [Luteimonas sp. BLCC-B24]MDC7807252.1 RnfH family protein [Luteimonas sp. BLCC-B24]
MKVDVVLARPRAVRSRTLELPDGATIAAALAAFGPLDAEIAGYAVYGVRATEDTVLRDGDRLELLRALQLDPKDARRRRAAKPAAR